MARPLSSYERARQFGLRYGMSGEQLRRELTTARRRRCRDRDLYYLRAALLLLALSIFVAALVAGWGRDLPSEGDPALEPARVETSSP